MDDDDADYMQGSDDEVTFNRLLHTTYPHTCLLFQRTSVLTTQTAMMLTTPEMSISKICTTLRSVSEMRCG